MLHYPPPVHGSGVVGGYIKQSALLNRTFDCRYINLGLSASVDEIGGNIFRKVFRYIGLIWKVKKQLIFSRPDLCYLAITAKGIGFYKDAFIVLLVRLFGIKPVYHFHNKGIATQKINFLKNLLYRIVFRNADVILISERLYYDFRKYVPENRVHYCTNGIPYQEDKRHASAGSAVQAKDKSSNARVEILFLSHLIVSKGVFVLIDACNLLKEKNNNFHCTIAGGDAELTRQEVEETVAEKGLTSYITVTGPLYGEEKAQIISSADIFVHPSYSDCLPLVLLEAMQHSLPVISTFEGAIPDVIEDGVTGFIVPQKDPAALAEKLEILIKNPDMRTRMGKEGREKYEREFTLDKFENRMVEILTVISRSV